MNNKLSDLNNFLFAQLERLDNEDLTDDELEKEIKRTKAITETGRTIVDNARLALDGQRFMAEYGAVKRTTLALPEMLEDRESDKADGYS